MLTDNSALSPILFVKIREKRESDATLTEANHSHFLASAIRQQPTANSQHSRAFAIRGDTAIRFHDVYRLFDIEGKDGRRCPRGAPLLAALFNVLMILTYFQGLVMFLPNLFKSSDKISRARLPQARFFLESSPHFLKGRGISPHCPNRLKAKIKNSHASIFLTK